MICHHYKHSSSEISFSAGHSQHNTIMVNEDKMLKVIRVTSIVRVTPSNLSDVRAGIWLACSDQYQKKTIVIPLPCVDVIFKKFIKKLGTFQYLRMAKNVSVNAFMRHSNIEEEFSFTCLRYRHRTNNQENERNCCQSAFRYFELRTFGCCGFASVCELATWSRRFYHSVHSSSSSFS